MPVSERSALNCAPWAKRSLTLPSAQPANSPAADDDEVRIRTRLQKRRNPLGVAEGDLEPAVAQALPIEVDVAGGGAKKRDGTPSPLPSDAATEAARVDEAGAPAAKLLTSAPAGTYVIRNNADQRRRRQPAITKPAHRTSRGDSDTG